MKKKLTVSLAVLALVACMAAGATLAWLTAKTSSVTNTFTYGDINIELKETTGESYKMVPGNTIAKDPKVTVKANSEECWLFVKVEKSNNFDKFMTYGIADGWTKLDGVDGVYYREVASPTDDTVFDVLKNNLVTVKEDVTKEDFAGLTSETMPTLTFTAYACQKDNVDSAADAWNLVK